MNVWWNNKGGIYGKGLYGYSLLLGLEWRIMYYSVDVERKCSFAAVIYFRLYGYMSCVKINGNS